MPLVAMGPYMRPVSDPFDALMDRLAALAVEAVQVSETAVQAYWLCLASAMLQHDSSSTLPLETLVQQAWLDGLLDEWARPMAPQALTAAPACGRPLGRAGVATPAQAPTGDLGSGGVVPWACRLGVAGIPALCC